MKLNTLRPAEGSKRDRKRVGRGAGSGVGKTAGRGHKGQKARSGGFHKVGFEGGQMPLQRRLPKFGFSSKIAAVTAQIRLHELNGLGADVIDLAVLKKAGLIKHNIESAKVIASGEVTEAVNLKSIRATAGAKKAIEAAGGSVE